LLGKNGQVGWELQRTLAPLGEITAIDKEELDLTRKQEIRSTVRSINPNLIVNAAAYTAVDRAEEEAELAMTINGIAPGILAEEAERCQAALIHYSTDYVFDGTNNNPYTEEDKPNPLNIYGKSKLAGDRAIQESGVPHLIFRTSWVYGLRGSNFLLTILRLAREREELQIINDQFGAPTWCRMVSEATALVVARGLEDIYAYADKNRGIYNLSAAGQTSWRQFAETILQFVDVSALKCQRIIPIPSSEYQTQARRPDFSVLDNGKFYKQFSLKMPSWESSLELVLAENH
jgi:dTDP-4-dehydrorhamnose reductase